MIPAPLDPTAIFEAERPRLFGIAYRMLGSVREAEDVVQDAWIRWERADRDAVENPAGYLVQTVTRLSVDVLRSAHARRIEYVGPWLPEPLVQDAEDPHAAQELADDLSQAFLLMLERLAPTERAVFLLRESFGFSYREIASVVGKSEENCRQIERRARQRLGGEPIRQADPQEHDRLLYSFLQATREGDLEGLMAVLSENVVALSDSGGRVSAARNPVHGPLNVARFFVGLARKAPEQTEFRLVRVNGRTGLAIFLDGQMFSVLAIHVENGRIAQLLTMRNPEKLELAERVLR
jgi:RNA polymerase sigma-70 factor, ECF subfamily